MTDKSVIAYSSVLPLARRRHNRGMFPADTMAYDTDDPTTDAWMCLACSYAEISLDCLRCTMCTAAQPRGSRSVLLVSRNSTHPAALAARGRKPLKARGGVYCSS